jgi:hypothetical protein
MLQPTNSSRGGERFLQIRQLRHAGRAGFEPIRLRCGPRSVGMRGKKETDVWRRVRRELDAHHVISLPLASPRLPLAFHIPRSSPATPTICMSLLALITPNLDRTARPRRSSIYTRRNNLKLLSLRCLCVHAARGVCPQSALQLARDVSVQLFELGRLEEELCSPLASIRISARASRLEHSPPSWSQAVICTDLLRTTLMSPLP